MDPLRLNLDDSLDERCGEIFLSLKGSIVFVCSVCDDNLKGYNKFIYHIKKHYYETFDVQKALLTENDSEISVINEEQKESNVVKIECVTDDDANFEILNFDIKKVNVENVSMPASFEDPISHNHKPFVPDKAIKDINFTKTKEKPKGTVLTESYKSECQKLPLDSVERKYKCKIECVTDEANFENVHNDIKQDEEENVSMPSNFEDAISQMNIEPFVLAQAISDINFTKPKEKSTGTVLIDSYKSKRERLPLDSVERKYKCEKCGFGFRDKSNLAAHMRRHSNEEKRFQCSHCSKRFHSRTEVRTHTRSHTKERPFLCTECGRAFVTSGALSKHTKRHKNLRDNHCPACEKSFFDRGLLRDHMLVHTGERAHKCPQCDASFSRIKALRCHQKLHENKREYECKLCPARFNQKPGLYSHMKSKHKT